MAATTPKRAKRKARRTWTLGPDVKILKIPMAEDDRLALYYLQRRLGHPGPQATVKALIKGMIQAMAFEDELKAKADAEAAAEKEPEYVDTAGNPVTSQPAEPPQPLAEQLAESVADLPAALDAVLVGDAADFPADGAGAGSVDSET